MRDMTPDEFLHHLEVGNIEKALDAAEQKYPKADWYEPVELTYSPEKQRMRDLARKWSDNTTSE